MSKVWGIQEGDFFKLVNLMNEFNSKNRVYATQVFQRGIEWFALIYYDEQGKDKGKPYSQPPSPDSNINNEVPATKKALNFLKGLGYKGDMNLTKSECWRLTQEWKKKEVDY